MKFKKIKKIIASTLIVISIFVVVPFNKEVNAKTFSNNTNYIVQEIKNERDIVYISPSTQYENSYIEVNGVKTTEGKVMQEIGEIVKTKLESRGIIVYMNNKQDGVNGHVVKGNNIKGVRCYVALHSNAVGGNNSGKAQGILVITRNDSESMRLSKHVYNKLQSIYPYKNKSRGIIINNKYREINSPNAPTLIAEIGFHDNKQDAEFLLNNKEKIANAVADAICDFLVK